jgi:hypothetical protein
MKIAQDRVQCLTLILAVLRPGVLIPESGLIDRLKTLSVNEGDPDVTNSL